MNKKTLNSILEDLAQSIGPYSEAIVIGGGYAPLIYKDFIANDHNLPQAAATFDLDLLLPHNTKIEPSDGLNLDDLLIRSGFSRQQKNLENPPVESYTKDCSGLDIEVEFLADNKFRGEKNVIKINGVNAQTLSFLEMSLIENMNFYTLNGIKLKVVLPAAWMFHKLLCFNRRQNQSKKLKDLYGAWYVGTILNNTSKQAVKDFDRLKIEHQSWYQIAKKAVTVFIQQEPPETWHLLEAQDPEGNLTKQRFILFAKMLFGSTN